MSQSTASFQSHRLQGFTDAGDSHLLRLVSDTKRLIAQVQKTFISDTLRLPSKKLDELVTVLVEFGEDIHNEIGIWNSLEQYNIQFFGTRCPFFLPSDEPTEQRALNRCRVSYLLWELYQELIPGLVLSPTHRDLVSLSTAVSDFFEERLPRLPVGLGIKRFLAQPNEYGWDVKKKLLWMGQHSYLFRNSFKDYTEEHGGTADIPTIDDFVCQVATPWSGLGVVDVLAAALDITEEQRSTLRSWHERHVAYYKVLEIDGPLMKLENIINGETYSVRVQLDTSQFRTGWHVFGSLVPWNGEWYWSGKQQTYDGITEETVRECRTEFLRSVPEIAYRYCGELAEKARESVDLHYQQFLAYHGDDFVLYPDGLSFAADWQKESRLQWASKSPEVISETMERHGLQNPWPSMNIPSALLNHKNGVGVYYDRGAGQDMMAGMNSIVSGFKKKGVNLTEDEENGIRSFVCSEKVSLGFVKRLGREYGFDSIAAAFLVRDSNTESHLEPLLRRYKGKYYRTVYPRVALLDQIMRT